MLLFDWIELAVFIVLFVVLVPILGRYMAKVYGGERTWLHPIFYPLEKVSYKLSGINPHEEMGWKGYLKALLYFNFFGLLALFLILLLQPFLPLNPEKMGRISWPLALNIAVSFVTNTNWQAYTPETELSYFSQMCGLTVQNFLSASTGSACFLALVRGIKRSGTEYIGNFWVDLVRTVIYILLPCSLIFALILVSQGVIQTFSPYVSVETIENQRQTIPLGPAASQIAIKQLGTNGGGFFAANSAHPFENPTSLTNFLQNLAILLLPGALIFTYGSLLEARRHAWILFFAMLLLFMASFAIALYAEQAPHPSIPAYPLLEGKETRIGVMRTLLWGVSTSATSNGSVNGDLSSLTPLAGGALLYNILLGELVFGGLGVGLCSLLMFVLLTLFLSGLMVGRTPEYQGKKIEKREVQWLSVAVLAPSALILIGSSIGVLYPPALSQIENRGPHGLSEMLYAFASTSGNNGSVLAGFDTNTNFFNKSFTLCMLLGRLSILVPSLAIAGELARKKRAPPSAGVFSTNTLLFLLLLLGVIILVGSLTFFPALCLGPFVEQMLMLKGVVF